MTPGPQESGLRFAVINALLPRVKRLIAQRRRSYHPTRHPGGDHLGKGRFFRTNAHISSRDAASYVSKLAFPARICGERP